MERPADLELGRLATPEEDEEFDEPEEEEEKLVDQGEEQEVVVRTEEKVVGEEKEHVEEEEEEEEEEDEVDVKKGEKISLLEGRESPPLSSANTSMNTSELPRVTETVVVLPNPCQASLGTQAAQARLSPPDPDIQLADLNPPHFRTRRLPSSNLTQLSSIHTVCGPRPARITAGCLLVLSLWAAFMLLIHMNKKIDNLSTSLESTNDKLKTMEEVSEEYRSQSLQRLQNMGKLIHALKRRGRPLGTESATSSPPPLPKFSPPPTAPPSSFSSSSTILPPSKSATTEDDSWDGLTWADNDW